MHPLNRNIWMATCILLAACSWGCKSSRTYVERGNQLFDAGKYDDATLSYRNAIQRDSRSGEAYYRLAKAQLKLNQAIDAYKNLHQAVSLSPDNIPAKIELATMCLAAYVGDPRHPAVLYNEARSLTDALLAKNASSPEALRLKGSISLVDNRPSEAVKTFQQALRNSPESLELPSDLAEALLRDDQSEAGERAARDAIAKHPQYAPPYELLYSFYATHGRQQDGEALLKSWIANSPANSTPVIRLATQYYRQQKPDEAEKLLDSLVQRQATISQADLLAGDFHALIRNWQKALADYQRGQSRDRSHETTYKERQAGVLVSMGRRDEALKLLETILAKDPKDVFSRSLKAQILFQLGGAKNIEASSVLANELAKDMPADGRLQMMAGQALMAKGDLDSATGRFQQAAKIDPQVVAPHFALAQVGLLRKNYSFVLDQAGAVLAVRPEDPTARLFRIMALTGLGSYAQAKAQAEQLGRSTKNAAPVEIQLGIIALNQKNYAEAEMHFRKVYREGDPNPYPLAGLINSYLGQHQPDRAIQLAEAELKRSPESGSKAALLVATAEKSGKPDIALSELQKLATQNPKSAEVQIRLAEFQRKQGNLPAALQALQRARQLAPQSRGLDAAIGNIQDEGGQKQEAIASYRKALSQMPDDPVVLNDLAFLLTETGGDLNEALQLATAASRKAPNQPAIEDTLAWIHVKRGNSAAVLPVLERLTRKDPANAIYRYHYAVALFEKGDRSSAKQQLQAALSERPAKRTENDIRSLLAKLQ
jgi:tetratricopeptide (TPR) repeat protein